MSHGNKCRAAVTQGRLAGDPPKFLVDTWSLCLVPDLGDVPYIALSYVWGPDAFFKTFSTDLTFLQTMNAFSDPQRRRAIPQTILDAMSITHVLGERYLWVDALCIVQDDEEMKQQEINNMGFIYANASITIIAREGTNAHYGLRGVRGVSQPRSTSQKLFRVNQRYTFVTGWVPHPGESCWHLRGWTFQEALFSRRTLSFDDGRVWWNCNCASFEEDFKPLPGYVRQPHYGSSATFPNDRSRRTFSTPLPDLLGFWSLVDNYNNKNLTNPEDAQAAFAGITTTLTPSFYDGFVCGIPLLFLDLLLCWQPIWKCTRRVSRQDPLSTKHLLPSWSWLGWQGNLTNLSSTLENFHRDDNVLCGEDTVQFTIPRVQWSSHAHDSDTIHPISGPHLLHAMQSEAQNDNMIIPEGWQRFKVPDSHVPEHVYETSDFPHTIALKYYFKHDYDPRREFWYPLPINQKPISENPSRNDSFLCCRTQKTVLYLGKSIHRTWHWSHHAGYHHRLHDQSGKWAGVMQLHDELETEASSGDSDTSGISYNTDNGVMPCELVMTSEGYVVEGPIEASFSEWKLEERPRRPDGEKYEFYNVLWVKWEDGIAYRNGCGRVMKSAWEALDPEWIDLTLG
jgi:hypothetical protein